MQVRLQFGGGSERPNPIPLEHGAALDDFAWWTERHEGLNRLAKGEVYLGTDMLCAALSMWLKYCRNAPEKVRALAQELFDRTQPGDPNETAQLVRSEQ